MTVGSVVKLKSGSPDLTVTGMGATYADVKWINSEGLQKARLPLVCLVVMEKK